MCYTYIRQLGVLEMFYISLLKKKRIYISCELTLLKCLAQSQKIKIYSPAHEIVVFIAKTTGDGLPEPPLLAYLRMEAY